MLAPRLLPPLRLRAPRSLHVSAPRRDRVAPPDPISHMRPIIYDDGPAPSPPTLLRHPYSLSEFNSSQNRLGDYELQLKLQYQQLDAFHHYFWLDARLFLFTVSLVPLIFSQSNTRFEGAKASIAESLPSTATPRDKEIAFSQFYEQWIMQEKERTDEYTTEWRRRNFALILLSTRLKYQKFTTRISDLFALNTSQ